MPFYRVSDDRATEVTISTPRERDFDAAAKLKVTMFNVGEGEAVLIVFPGRRAWLVDIGTNGKTRNKTLGLAMLDHLEQERLSLETIIASHAHFDHAGAIATVLGTESTSTRGRIDVFRGEADWGRGDVWLTAFRNVFTSGWAEEEIRPPETNLVFNAPTGAANLIVGRGSSVYTSLFLHLHFGATSLLFTGDAMCTYENALLDLFAHNFGADVLKVTHHGSSSGTGRRFLGAVRPGIAISSSAADDPDHMLEQDTRGRLRGSPIHRQVFETGVNGDITLTTDGLANPAGILYKVESSADAGNVGEFAAGVSASTISLTAANANRRANASGVVHPGCA